MTALRRLSLTFFLVTAMTTSLAGADALYVPTVAEVQHILWAQVRVPSGAVRSMVHEPVSWFNNAAAGAFDETRYFRLAHPLSTSQLQNYLDAHFPTALSDGTTEGLATTVSLTPRCPGLPASFCMISYSISNAHPRPALLRVDVQVIAPRVSRYFPVLSANGRATYSASATAADSGNAPRHVVLKEGQTAQLVAELDQLERSPQVACYAAPPRWSVNFVGQNPRTSWAINVGGCIATVVLTTRSHRYYLDGRSAFLTKLVKSF